MDFYQICTKETKAALELYPDFTVGRSKDLMVRGKQFYAIWDEERQLWSTDEYDVQRLVDEELRAKAESSDLTYNVKYLQSYANGGWAQFKKYLQNLSDSSHQLDQNLTFSNTEVRKSDYVSRRLPYPLEEGDYSAWDELVGTLYSVEERAKIEWAIGAVVSGDSKKIQKFLVLYGPAGTGKSTVLNIIQKLFEGYTTSFEAKALGSNNNSFSTEVFKNNPLVAIQHDGDLSRIEDNTKLNSIISHEDMTMNEKYKPSYTSSISAFLFMGTNQPVKISDAKSGIIRRLIDVHPTGVKIPANHYHTLMGKIDFELGAIAHHCLNVYRKLGKNHYNAYRPLEMMLQTDIFFNFIESAYDIFKSQDGASLRQAYNLYKEFCADTGIEKQLPQYKVREELRNYFDDFKDRHEVDGHLMRSYYIGFNANKFKTPTKEVNTFSLVLDEAHSLLDEVLADQPAQYANVHESPMKKWEFVKATLDKIDTTKLHYVKVPETHIVIDFDLKGEDGGKSLERNLEAASSWPATYAELSKSGGGVHLHYNWTGSGGVSELRQDFSDGIEVKTFHGDSSLRRRVSRCNAVPISDLNSGLPIKEKKMLTNNTITSEKGLRDLIERNLRKEIHPGTKPSIDFIAHILEEAQRTGMNYDVTDMRGRILAFANNSSNQPLIALKIVQKMPFANGTNPATGETEAAVDHVEGSDDKPVVLFDVEVYPNLFIICWKYRGAKEVVRMRNPHPQDVEALFHMKLVGFNCRRYDNHILYAAHMGYTNEQLYKLSKKIIDNVPGAGFGEAYNLSYADLYELSSIKQSLKKWEIELGIHHMELDLPWDEPVPDDQVERVEDYCVNDVNATEAVLDDREQDYVARQILTELSGLTMNHTTQQHTAKIVFGNDRNPQRSFQYTHLAEQFPGYVYEMGVSTYRGETVGEGGYVYAEPGMYEDVVLLDVASMHPTSIEVLNAFGDFTPNFSDLKAARLAIKHRKYAEAKKMLGGKLAPYLKDEADAQALSWALKIVINIVYGLTSARFDNPFKDPRNKDNFIAKRGALFMIDLKHFCQGKGLQVVHIKTDSIKIPGASAQDIVDITEFGKKYGYDFEHEATYDKLCLVNDAVYIAREGGKWTAIGTQFQRPYVFKTLFSGEVVTFDDMCETKQVTKGSMYLDFDLDRAMINPPEGMHFVGRSGRFVPVIEGYGGGVLFRVNDDKRYAVAGTKGYLWLESEIAKGVEGINDIIDMKYFNNLLDEATAAIEKFGNMDDFLV